MPAHACHNMEEEEEEEEYMSLYVFISLHFIIIN